MCVCVCAGSLLSGVPASTASVQDNLSSAVHEAIDNLLESSYPVPCVLCSLSDLQKQLVSAAERLRDGPYSVTFEVCSQPTLRVYTTVCV